MLQKNSAVCLIFGVLRLLLSVICFILILLLAFPIGFYGMAMYIEPSLPNTDKLKQMPLQMPLQIYSADGKLIGQYGNTYSMPVHYEELPDTLIKAFLAAEDDSFFEHSGISVKGLGRAIAEMLTNDSEQTGGSSITQQVAKNYFLTPEQTFERKLTEMYLARRIERKLSKDDIMELYVNKIYMGQGAYGIKAGARRYYNKDLNELTIAEMAMLAGLPKAPSAFNPVVNPKRALQRRNWILGRMLSEGFIDRAQYDEAVASDIGLSIYQDSVDVDMPYLAEMARAALVARFGEAVMNSGWRVQLTVDTKIQQAAQQAVVNGLNAYDRRHGYRGGGVEAASGDLGNFYAFDGLEPAKVERVFGGGFEATLKNGATIAVSSSRRLQAGNIVRVQRAKNGNWQLVRVPSAQGALAAIDPQSGALIAAAGGYNFYQSRFNRALQGYRQPGSVIKPLIYAGALEYKNYTPNTVVNDSPLRIGNWAPKNADGSFRGGMSLRQAVAASRNLPVVRAYLEVGREKTHTLLGNFGLDKNRLPDGAALALGATEATPLQMATAYAAFINGGHRVQPYFIERIYNFQNDLIYQANPARACSVCFNSQLDEANRALLADFAKNSDKPTLALQSDNETDKTDTDAEQSDENKNRVYRLQPNAAAQHRVAAQAPRILSKNAADSMADMLQTVVRAGTGRRALALGRSDVGGKTGTTNLAKDAWFAGVQPTVSAVVWVGFDTPKSLGAREYGGVAALPVWVDFMRVYLADKPVQWIAAPKIQESAAAKTPSAAQADAAGEPPKTDAAGESESENNNSGESENFLQEFERDGEIPEGDGE